MLTDQVDGIFLVNNCSGRFSSSQICKIIFHSSPLHLSGGRGSKYQTAATKSPAELVKSQTPRCHPEDAGSGAPRGPPEPACLTSPPGVPGGHPTCVSSATCRRILGASLPPSSSVPVPGRHPLTTKLQDPSPLSHSCRGLSTGCFWPLDKLCLARMAFLRIGIFLQCLKPGRCHVVMPAMLSPSPPPGARDLVHHPKGHVSTCLGPCQLHTQGHLPPLWALSSCALLGPCFHKNIQNDR